MTLHRAGLKKQGMNFTCPQAPARSCHNLLTNIRLTARRVKPARGRTPLPITDHKHNLLIGTQCGISEKPLRSMKEF